MTFNDGRTAVILRLPVLKMLICHAAVLVYLCWYLNNNSAELCDYGGMLCKRENSQVS